MSNGEIIKIAQAGPVRWIVLNRPEVSNAYTFGMLEYLAEIIEAAVADPLVHAIVLAGEGPNFQSGLDMSALAERANNDEEDAATVAQGVYTVPQRVAKALYHCPKPTIAALQGAVLTMGCEYALCCDFRIVTPDTFLQEKWIRFGLLPALGGLKILPDIVGSARAKEIILRGGKIKGPEALSMGLATECVPASDLRSAAQRLGEELAGLSGEAYSEAKRVINAGADTALAEVLDQSAQAQGRLLVSQHFRDLVRGAASRNRDA